MRSILEQALSIKKGRVCFSRLGHLRSQCVIRVTFECTASEESESRRNALHRYEAYYNVIN